MNLLDLIKARRAVCDAAAPGPWKGGGLTFDTVNPPHFHGSVHWEDGLSMDALRSLTHFIAASRNERPQELDALAIAVEYLEEIESDARDYITRRDATEAIARIRAKLEASGETNQ